MALLPGLNVRFPEYLDVVPTIQALRSFNYGKVKAGDTIQVTGSVTFNDSNGADYVWDPLSVLPDDGANVIRPNAATIGRWIIITSKTTGPAGPPSNNVADITALAALTPTSGDRYVVKSALGSFTFRSGDYSSQITSDTRQVLYVKASSIPATTGAWVRDYVDCVDATWAGAVNGGDCSGAVNYLGRFNVPIFIPAGEYNNTDSIILGGEGMKVFGAGVDTKINNTTGYAGIYIVDGKNCVVSDMWLHKPDTDFNYGQIQIFHATVRDLTIERIRTTQKIVPGTNPGAAINSVKLVMDNSPVPTDGRGQGLDGCIIRDCQFLNVGRMGIEIQNHGNKTAPEDTADGTAILRYHNILIENCLIEDAGIVDLGGAGMGVSFTGPGENVVFQNNIIRRARGPSIEMIGCHRSSMLHNTIDDPYGNPFSCANVTIMQDCVIAHNKTVNDTRHYASAIYSFSRLKFHSNSLSSGAVFRCLDSHIYNNTFNAGSGTVLNVEGAQRNVFNGNTIYVGTGYGASLYYTTTQDNVLHSNVWVATDARDVFNSGTFFGFNDSVRSVAYGNIFRNSVTQNVQAPPRIQALPNATTPLSSYILDNGTAEFNGGTGANNLAITYNGAAGIGQPYVMFEVLWASRQDNISQSGQFLVSFGNANLPTSAPRITQLGTVISVSGGNGTAVTTGSSPQVTAASTVNGNSVTTTISFPANSGGGRVFNIRVRATDNTTLGAFSVGPA
jgi:hypothetical protein